MEAPLEKSFMSICDTCETDKILNTVCASVNFGRLTEDCTNAIRNHFKNSTTSDLEGIRIYTPNTILYGTQVECDPEMVIFGNKPSKPNHFICGKFAIVHGLFMLVDAKASKQLYIKTDDKSTLIQLLNKLVLIKKFHILAEMYVDGAFDCIFANASDILNLHYTFEPVKNIQLSIDANMPYKFSRKIRITHISSAVLIPSTNKFIIYIAYETSNTKQVLRLPEYYLNTIAFLEVGSTYLQLYSHKIKKLHLESSVYDILQLEGYIYLHKDMHFVRQEFNRIEPVKSLENTPGLYTIRVRVQSHFLNTDRNPRPYKRVNKDGLFVGTLPHNVDHRLVVQFENGSSSLYFNNFKFKPVPIGAQPGAELIIYNVLRSESYYKSTILTHMVVDGIAYPLDSFTTANLCEEGESEDYETLENVDQLMVNYWTILHLRLEITRIHAEVDTHWEQFMMQVVVEADNIERKLVTFDFQIFIRILFPFATNKRVLEPAYVVQFVVHLDDLSKNSLDLRFLPFQRRLFTAWGDVFRRIKTMDLVCLRDLSPEFKILKLINFELGPS